MLAGNGDQRSRAERIALSVAAALLTVGALFVLEFLFAGFRVLALGSNLIRIMWLATVVLFALGACTARPIIPFVYAFVVAGTLPVITFVLLNIHSGNLGGLVFVMSVVIAVATGLPVAVIGSLLRLRRLPSWLPYALTGVGVFGTIGLSGAFQYVATKHKKQIVVLMEQIRESELAFAANRPDHSFTCNGPDLAIRGVAWRASEALGTREKNEAPANGFWIYLRCEPSAHPRSFVIRAASTEGTGIDVDLDSNGRFTGSLAGLDRPRQ